MWARAASLLCCASCATASSAVPAEAMATLDPGPPMTDEALARVWEPEAPPRAPPAAEPPPVAPSPAREKREAFQRLRDEARQALRAHRLEEARPLIADAVEQARGLTGHERLEAGQLAFSLERESGDAPAQSAALAWRRACGPEALEACRASALGALAQLRSAEAKALVARLREAEACLAAREALGCLPKVERAASAAGDDVLASRAAFVRALAEHDEGRRAAALGRLQERCGAPGCQALRHRALSLIAAWARGKGDYAAAARALIRDAHLGAPGVDPEARLYARPPELDDVCAKLDAADGARTCRRLEKQLAGSWTFRDFSRRKVGASLPAADVRAVHQHFEPLLDACLTEEARRLEPPDARQYEVHWVVRNDGHVYDAHLRADLDATPLAQCLRQQFATWRYPRFDGEFQNVSQTFTVTAAVRSAMRTTIGAASP